MGRLRAVGLGIGVAVAVMRGAQPVSAQTPSNQNTVIGRVFIDAAAIADYDQWNFETQGPTLAAGVGIGARLGRRRSLRFEFDIPGAPHVAVIRNTGSEERYESNTRAFAFLLARHFRMDKRVPVVFLAGVTVLTTNTHLTGFINSRPRDGTGVRQVTFDDDYVDQWSVLTLGLEVPVAITRHLQVVPQVRPHVEPSLVFGAPASWTYLAQPRLSLRWRF